MTDLYPLELSASLRPKIWGRRDLAPFFGEQSQPIGEAWFSFEENTVANGPLAGQALDQLMARFGRRLLGDFWRPSSRRRRSAGEAPVETAAETHLYFPILSKLLFPSAKLSVQVHPDDEFALSNEGGPGKTEAWYVVEAEPGASLALGLTELLAGAELRQAAASGEIERILNWIRVRPGDCYFVPPGTIHTIGPGLTLCEIQQNSDLTYRLYDFGRTAVEGAPRSLHVEKAAAVTMHRPVLGPQRSVRLSDRPLRRDLLVACSHFAVESLQWEAIADFEPDAQRFELLLFLQGEGRIADFDYDPGSAYLIPATAERFALSAFSPSTAIRAYVPDIGGLRLELERAGAATEEIERLLVK